LELKRLINFLDEVKVACTFFVVPYGDRSYPSATEKFTSYLRVALDGGHELALHGYRHTKNEFGCFYPIPLPIPLPTLKKQKERLEKGLANMMSLMGVRPLGFRAPFYLHNNVTLKVLSSLDFYYDSSETIFKPAHGMHLRIKWLRDCRPFVREHVMEIPVSGDYTYNLKRSNFSDFLRIAVRDFEWVKSRQGVFVLNNHPQHLSDNSYRFLRTLIKQLSKRTDFLRLCDVAKMYL
jgi:peptidoglycan/xylan/chitin deacetylase (PgdA/CDA1 family)